MFPMLFPILSFLLCTIPAQSSTEQNGIQNGRAALLDLELELQGIMAKLTANARKLSDLQSARKEGKCMNEMPGLHREVDDLMAQLDKVQQKVHFQQGKMHNLVQPKNEKYNKDIDMECMMKCMAESTRKQESQQTATQKEQAPAMLGKQMKSAPGTSRMPHNSTWAMPRVSHSSALSASLAFPRLLTSPMSRCNSACL